MPSYLRRIVGAAWCWSWASHPYTNGIMHILHKIPRLSSGNFLGHLPEDREPVQRQSQITSQAFRFPVLDHNCLQCHVAQWPAFKDGMPRLLIGCLDCLVVPGKIWIDRVSAVIPAAGGIVACRPRAPGFDRLQIPLVERMVAHGGVVM